MVSSQRLGSFNYREEDLAAKEAELLQLTGHIIRRAGSARSTPETAAAATPSAAAATPNVQVDLSKSKSLLRRKRSSSRLFDS